LILPLGIRWRCRGGRARELHAEESVALHVLNGAMRSCANFWMSRSSSAARASARYVQDMVEIKARPDGELSKETEGAGRVGVIILNHPRKAPAGPPGVPGRDDETGARAQADETERDGTG